MSCHRPRLLPNDTRPITNKPMKHTHTSAIAPLSALILTGLLAFGAPQTGFARNKGKAPPTPTPHPSATPVPSPTPTPPNATPTPTPSPTPSNPDTTIDNRFVTVGLEVGDGRDKPALDVYSNILIHSNARIATAQGFYTASGRGSSGIGQNPTPTPAPDSTPNNMLRNDDPPKTAVDWGWSGNKKPKKIKKH